MDYNLFNNIPDVEVKFDENLSQYTTLKLNFNYNIVIVKSEQALLECIHLFKKNNVKYVILGNGSNLVFSDKFNDIILKLALPYDKNAFNDLAESYTVSASTPLSYLTKAAIKHGLKGWEVITGIPASLGGAVAMNAGTGLGEIKNIVKDFTVVKKNGERVTYFPKDDSFSYRKNNLIDEGDIIVTVTLIHAGIDLELASSIKEYLTYRKQTQPLSTNNCGCVFKNYNEDIRAGATIDKLGLKGFTIRGLSISKKHGNFFENDGSATYTDFKELVDTINNKVYQNYGIKFELEVKVY
jgi:UDP-N-acetylmuramate dehydrogenase